MDNFIVTRHVKELGEELRRIAKANSSSPPRVALQEATLALQDLHAAGLSVYGELRKTYEEHPEIVELFYRGVGCAPIVHWYNEREKKATVEFADKLVSAGQVFRAKANAKADEILCSLESIYSTFRQEKYRWEAYEAALKHAPGALPKPRGPKYIKVSLKTWARIVELPDLSSNSIKGFVDLLTDILISESAFEAEASERFLAGSRSMALRKFRERKEKRLKRLKGKLKKLDPANSIYDECILPELENEIQKLSEVIELSRDDNCDLEVSDGDKKEGLKAYLKQVVERLLNQ
jgi:exonuclease VII large subunit